MSKRMGRPPKATKERRDAYVRLRLTQAELTAIRKAAKAAGLTVSEFLRRAAAQR